MRTLGALVVAALVVGCGAPASTGAPTGQAPSAVTTVPPTVPPPTAPLPSPSSVAITGPIIGSWHRAQTCEEMLAVFEAVGLAESHREWLAGQFFGGEPPPETGPVCEGAFGPLEHSHFFTATGGFGSHDEHGQQVDGGDFAVVDVDTLSFPSHASEFGYDGEVLVDYVIEDDVVTFDVILPDGCTDRCADAYAWALTAFATGPWEAGEIP